MANTVKKYESPNLNTAFTAKLLGAAIRAKRSQSRLRLEDAASLCGVAKQTLMKIEHGQGTSQLASILQICDGLGIKLQILPWADEANDGW